jgi:hypothetical protein
MSEQIHNVLKRLSRYYADRAKIALGKARESIDAQSMEGAAMGAAHWEARHDAVLKVAENLGIALEEAEEDVSEESNTCNVCGGILRFEWIMAFEQCRPRDMRVEPRDPMTFRLCPGHGDTDIYARYEALMQLATRYYILLRVVSEGHWERAMTPFWNAQREQLQASAEDMGISDTVKAEEAPHD